MGAGASTSGETEFMPCHQDQDYKEFLESQRETFELMLNDKLDLGTQIEHYYPPSFPIEPVVTHRTVVVCRESWEMIKKTERNGRSGMVYFFDVFYMRLFDRSSSFKDFFQGDMKKKGKILIRIMEFFCAIDVDNLNGFYKSMLPLARVHNQRNIRPWMYSVFVETMVNSISYVLDDLATLEVSTAWTNIAALAMRALLPGSIMGQIKKQEANVVYFDEEAKAAAAAKTMRAEKSARVESNSTRKDEGVMNSGRASGCPMSGAASGGKKDVAGPSPPVNNSTHPTPTAPPGAKTDSPPTTATTTPSTANPTSSSNNNNTGAAEAAAPSVLAKRPSGARLPPINESSNQHSADGGAWGSGKINVPHVTPTKETSP